MSWIDSPTRPGQLGAARLPRPDADTGKRAVGDHDGARLPSPRHGRSCADSSTRPATPGSAPARSPICSTGGSPMPSPAWSASTLRETRSLIELSSHAAARPSAGDKLTTVDIDDLYRHLLRAGGRDGRPLAPGTVHRVHVVLHRALTQAVRWEWIWLNPASARLATAGRAGRDPTAVDRSRSAGSSTSSVTPTPTSATYLRLAASTGARRSQLLGLALVRHRLRPRRPRVHPGARRRTRPARSFGHQEPPHLPRGARPRHPRPPRRAPATGRRRGRPSGVDFDGRLRVHRRPDAVDGPGSRTGSPRRFIGLPAACRRWTTSGCTIFATSWPPPMLAAGVPVVTVVPTARPRPRLHHVNVYAHCIPGADRDAANFIADLITSS